MDLPDAACYSAAMSRRALFTLIAVVIIGGGALAAMQLVKDDAPVDASGPTRIAASRPSSGGDGFRDVAGPSLATGSAEAEQATAKPTGPQMHPEVRAKVDDLQKNGIVPAPPTVPSRARLTQDVEWSKDPAVLDAARKGALAVLAKSPGDPIALRTMVMVSCETGNRSAAGKYLTGLPRPDQAMMATRCKAHGVDLPLPSTPDRFNRPGANPTPAPPTKTRTTPAPK